MASSFSLKNTLRDCMEQFYVLSFYDWSLRYLSMIQPIFNFSTAKFVLIKDYRLGFLNRLFQLIILIYILTDIILRASYQAQEVPKGFVTTWSTITPDMRADIFKNQSKIYNEGFLKYCNRPEDYDFQRTNMNYNDFKCVFMDPLALSQAGESQFFLTTYMRVEKLMFYHANSEEECEVSEDTSTDELLIFMYDTCIFYEEEEYFPVIPEFINIQITHSYFTSQIGKSGTNPKTFIRSPNYSTEEDIIEIEAGKDINLPISKWLQLSGVELDSKLNEQPNKVAEFDETARGEAEYEREYPKARLSGLNFLVTFNYYQKKLAPDEFRKSAGSEANDIVCHIDVEPKFIWSTRDPDVSYVLNSPKDPIFLDPQNKEFDYGNIYSTQVNIMPNGILFNFQVAGNLGEFSWNALIDAIVDASVLLSISQIIVTYVALYALGLTSQLYLEFIKESVDWRQEYGRFASQALVAAYAFNGIDANKSGHLSRTEVFACLYNIFQKKLETVEIACLTDFMMRQSEEDTNVRKGQIILSRDMQLENNKIEALEWIDIFTENKVSRHSLKRLINSQYKDEETRNQILNSCIRGNEDELPMSISRDYNLNEIQNAMQNIESNKQPFLANLHAPSSKPDYI